MRPVHALALLLILGGLGSILLEFSKPLGVVMILLGTIGALLCLKSSETNEKRNEALFAGHASLLAKAGAGNAYTEAAKHEYLKSGSLDSAMQFIGSALEIDPTDSETFHIAGLLVITDISLRQWIAKRREVRRMHPGVRFSRAMVKRGLELDPEKGEFYEVLGIIQDVEGKHGKARRNFRRYHGLTRNPRAYVRLGVSWMQSEQPDKAIMDFRRAVSEGAGGWDVALQLGRALLSLAEYEDAEAQLRSAHREAPSRPEPCSALADALWYLARPIDSARAEWAAGIRLFRLSYLESNVRFGKAVFAYLIGAYCGLSKAVVQLVSERHPRLRRSVLALLSPDEPELTIGEIHFEEGRYAAGEVLFRRAAEIRPRRASTRSNLAVALAMQGKKDAALSEIDVAIKLDPEHAGYQHNRDQIEGGHCTPKSRIVSMGERQSRTASSDEGRSA